MTPLRRVSARWGRMLRHPMLRPSLLGHVALYGGLLAGLALMLDAMGRARVSHGFSEPAYVVAVALVFAGLGIWLGQVIAPRHREAGFRRNDAALAALAISPREIEVLEALAEGAPNKIIARRLGISPNTVKTHNARLFEKLGAANRTEAIARARELDLLP